MENNLEISQRYKNIASKWAFILVLGSIPKTQNHEYEDMSTTVSTVALSTVVVYGNNLNV